MGLVGEMGGKLVNWYIVGTTSCHVMNAVREERCGGRKLRWFGVLDRKK